MSVAVAAPVAADTDGRRRVRILDPIGRTLVVPFPVFRQANVALRVSNLTAIVMLFCLGYWLGQHSGRRPLRTGSTMVLLGLVLVAITIVLGG